MKRFFRALVAASCLTVLAGVCQTASAADTYKIGAIYPLTGYLAWQGEYGKKGAELRVEQINRAGGVNGRQLELIVYDDQSSPESATRVAQRLISKDEVVAITGTETSPISAAVASIANKSKIPTIVNSGYAISQEKDAYVFNAAHTTESAIGRAMQWLQKQGLTKVALLMPIGPLGELGSSVSNKNAVKYKLEIVGEEKFDVKSPDLTAQLAKLRTLNPQALLTFSTGEPAALVARSAAQMGFTIPVIVSHGNANPGFLKLVSQVPGTIIVPTGKVMAADSIPDSDPVKKVVTSFGKEHEAKYGEPASYIAGLAADSISLIAEALKTAGNDPEKVRDALENIKGFVGMQGVYNMSAANHYGTATDDMILITIENGKWKVVP